MASKRKLKKQLKRTKARLHEMHAAATRSTDPEMIPRGVFRAAATTLDDVESRLDDIWDYTDKQITACDPQDSGRLGRLQELQRLTGESLRTVDVLRDPKATPRPTPTPTLIPQMPTSNSARMKAAAEQLTPEMVKTAQRMGWSMETVANAAMAAASGSSSTRPTPSTSVSKRLTASQRTAAAAMGWSEEQAMKALEQAEEAARSREELRN